MENQPTGLHKASSGVGLLVKGILLLPVFMVIALLLYLTRRKGKKTT